MCQRTKNKKNKKRSSPPNTREPKLLVIISLFIHCIRVIMITILSVEMLLFIIYATHRRNGNVLPYQYLIFVNVLPGCVYLVAAISSEAISRQSVEGGTVAGVWVGFWQFSSSRSRP